LRPLRADQPLLGQLGGPLLVSGALHGPGELAAAPAARRHHHVPVEEAGESRRRLRRDPVPQPRAELRDLRAKVKFHGKASWLCACRPVLRLAGRPGPPARPLRKSNLESDTRISPSGPMSRDERKMRASPGDLDRGRSLPEANFRTGFYSGQACRRGGRNGELAWDG